MNFKEITTRLKAEGISLSTFCQEYFDEYSTATRQAAGYDKLPWLGEVKLVAQQEESWAEGGRRDLVYHLLAHDVYVQASSFLEYPPDKDDYPEEHQAWDEAHPNDEFIWNFMDAFSPVKPVTKTVVEYKFWPDNATEAELAELTADMTDRCLSCDVCHRPPEIKYTSLGELKSNKEAGYYTVVCPSCTQYVVGENSLMLAAPRTEAEHEQAMQQAVQSWNKTND
jgi:hypothetical protein